MAKNILKEKGVPGIGSPSFTEKTMLTLTEGISKYAKEHFGNEVKFKLEREKAYFFGEDEYFLVLLEGSGWGSMHDPDVDGSARSKVYIRLNSFELIEDVEVGGAGAWACFDDVPFELIRAYDDEKATLEDAIKQFYKVLPYKLKELKGAHRRDGCGGDWEISYGEDYQKIVDFFDNFTEEVILKIASGEF